MDDIFDLIEDYSIFQIVTGESDNDKSKGKSGNDKK